MYSAPVYAGRCSVYAPLLCAAVPLSVMLSVTLLGRWLRLTVGAHLPVSHIVYMLAHH